MNEIGDDDQSTNSLSSNENNLNHMRLMRRGSNLSSYSSSGYLFLAVVFCMMCCSSIVLTPFKSTFNSLSNASQAMKSTYVG